MAAAITLIGPADPRLGRFAERVIEADTRPD